MPRKPNPNANPILAEAARIRSGLRARVSHVCARCGAPFVGVRQAQFCSSKCRQVAFHAKKKSQKPPDLPTE